MRTAAIEKAEAALGRAYAAELKRQGWRSIKTAPKDGTHIHVWMQIGASPMSMGMADEFAVPDAWFQDGKWGHLFRGKFEPLAEYYITHWMPVTGSLEGIEVHRG